MMNDVREFINHKGKSMKCMKAVKVGSLFAVFCFVCSTVFAVSSKIEHHKSAADFMKGETEDVIIDSAGFIKLSNANREIAAGFDYDGIWTINSMAVTARGELFAGTSPEGIILMYEGGELKKVYPKNIDGEDERVYKGGGEYESDGAGGENVGAWSAGGAGEEAIEGELRGEPNEVESFGNLHIFAMGLDDEGRPLAAVSGERAELLRWDGDEFESFYTLDEETLYIHCIAVDEAGNIYLGTGPGGKIYRVQPSGEHSQVFFESRDNNILSMVIGDDGYIYAGTDERGVVYRIDPADGEASVLFDSEQDEITAIIYEAGRLLVTATSAGSISKRSQPESIMAGREPGRPDVGGGGRRPMVQGGSRQLKIANNSGGNGQNGQGQSPQPIRGAAAKKASYVYEIDSRGFVNEVFSEQAVFYSLGWFGDVLLLGTGNNGQLFSIQPEQEESAVVFQDDKAAQITAVAVAGDFAYAATSNPAGLVEIKGMYADEGNFSSSLVDAGQPAMWGKIQIGAELPEGTKVFMACRSGNVKDPNAPTFSPWSDERELKDATELVTPLGRYCQYRLRLLTDDTSVSPVVREAAVSYAVPNLRPRVVSVDVQKGQEGAPSHLFSVKFKGEDENDDKLVYELQFRKVEWGRWITFKEDLEASEYQWDTRGVADGHYEVRVLASDEKANGPMEAMSGARISEPFVVDNNEPAIEDVELKVEGGKAVVNFRGADEFTVIGECAFSVDSSEDYVSILPDDGIFDTLVERFTIITEQLDAGVHIVTVRVADDMKNTAYETFVVEVEQAVESN